MPTERCPELRRRVVEGLAKRYFTELYRLLEKLERFQMDRIIQAGQGGHKGLRPLLEKALDTLIRTANAEKEIVWLFVL